MIPRIRSHFNQQFTEEKYKSFLQKLDAVHPGAIEFRVAETPVFVPRRFRDDMLETCESVIDLITTPSFKNMTERAIPAGLRVPGEEGYPQFIAFDFGICEGPGGEPEPQLIELQGFPTLFAFQVSMADTAREVWDIPENFSPYLGGYNRESYLELLKEVIVGEHHPGQVVLLELFPHQQKTRVDFYCTRQFTGIPIVCLTELIREGNKLYYLNNGVKTEIRALYNRIIFDELLQQPGAIREKGKLLFEDLDIKWIPHPNWFYRVSKFTLPFLRDPQVPATYFLNEVQQLPSDLHNYVLKPLFSFAGRGVKIDITRADIDAISDPENWILQRKVNYAEIIKTPDGPAKAEIRIFYFWKDGEPRPVPVNNLARLSKGKMIGVSYNRNKTWVGGSLCLFEK